MWTSHKFIQSKWKNNILKKNNKQTTHFMTYYIIYENIFIPWDSTTKQRNGTSTVGREGWMNNESINLSKNIWPITASATLT
jgi:hypothetical protein